MSKKSGSTNRGFLESKRLRVESLEVRQLLSVNPVNVDPGVPACFATVPTDTNVNYEVADEAVALAADLDEVEENTHVEVEGNLISVTFPASAGSYTAVLTYTTGYNSEGNSVDTIDCLNFEIPEDKITEGTFTWLFEGELRLFPFEDGMAYLRDYSIEIYQGTYADINAIPEDATQVAFVDCVDIAPSLEIAVADSYATKDSITIMSMYHALGAYSIEVRARFNGAEEFTDYHLVLDEETGNYSLTNEDGSLKYALEATGVYTVSSSFAISGLEADKEHVLQIRTVTEDYFGSDKRTTLWSNIVTARTTTATEQVSAPEDLLVSPLEGSEATTLHVTWTGEANRTYTVKYRAFDEDGEYWVMSPEVTLDADAITLGENNAYSCDITGLAPCTLYYVDVIANDANENVEARLNPSIPAADGMIMTDMARLPVAVLNVTGSTDSTASIQITNWSAMAELLKYEGVVTVSVGETNDEYSLKDGVWTSDAGTLTIAEDGETATILLSGLESATRYSCIVTTSAKGCYSIEEEDSPEPAPFTTQFTAPALEVSGVTDDAATITITNWDTLVEQLDGKTGGKVALMDGETEVAVFDSATITLSELAASTKYDYTVAISADDFGVVSAPVSVQTLGSLYAVSNKITASFEAEVGNYTAVVNYTLNGKETTQYKNFSIKKASDALETWIYTGKAGMEYSVKIYAGKFNAKTIGEATDLVVDDKITTLAASKLTVDKAATTADSITIQMNELPADVTTLEFNAKFNAAKKAEWFDVTETEGTYNLVNRDDTTKTYLLTYNAENKSLTISGLDPYAAQSVAVVRTTADAESALSNQVRISTTKDQQAAPTEVQATLATGAESSSIDVTWKGAENLTYTVQYSFVGKNGKETVKVASKKVAVEEIEGEYVGQYTIAKLAGNTDYTISVIANKDKTNDASAAEKAAEVVKTWAVIPTATLKKVKVTENAATTAKIQITNWSKMADLLQVEGANSVICVDLGDDLETLVLNYEQVGEGIWGWTSDDMVLTVSENGKTADILINGLSAKTTYRIVVTTSADSALSVASRALKITTAIEA